MNEIIKTECDNKARGCSKTFMGRKSMVDHMNNSCSFGTNAIKCRHQNCNEIVHPKQLNFHEQTCGYGKAKKNRCPNNCGWSTDGKDMTWHRKAKRKCKCF